MNQRYLVMYGHTAGPTTETFAWGGTSPDLPGCVSVGDSLEEMRAMMKEAVEGHLQAMADDGDPIPGPLATMIDFAQETPENGVDYCVVEYLQVQLPAISTYPAHQASIQATPNTALTATPQDQGHHG